MRVAALHDVHGNLPALEAVLAELERERPDVVVFGGDVAAGLLPRETVDLAMTVPNARFVMGNADRELVEPARLGGLVDEWTVAQLDDRRREFLRSFEPTVSLDGVLYCHATPHSDEQIFTRISPDEHVLEVLRPVDESTVVCGHTHVQFERNVDGILVVNAGSVGMPYGTTHACWALAVDAVVELRQTAYDLEAAAERLRASGHGMRDRLIAENVLASPSADDATEFFEQQVRVA